MPELPQTSSSASAKGDGAQAANNRAVINDGSVGGHIITGTQIVNNYIANDGIQKNQAQLTRQIDSYLRWVQERYGKIELRGIERGGRKVLQLDLDQAYANLSAKVMLTRAERSGVMGWIDKLARRPAKTDSDDGPIGVSGAISLDGEHGMQDEDIPLDGLFSLGQRLVVTGGPGCGKTTVLLHIAWALASAIADGNTLAKDKLGLDAPLPLPIFVPLAAYARHLRQLKGKPNAEGERRLSHFINQYLLRRDADFDLPADFFNCLLRDGQSVALLLDGLDEVSNEDERAMVRQAAEELVQGRPDMRVVVTCRTAAYHDQTALGSHFREIIVKPLEEAQVREMVQRFYGCIHTQEPKLAEERTGELLEGVNTLERARQSRGDERLIGSPLMVRLLLIVHYNERRMPDQRAELFMKAAEAMIQLDYLPDVEVAQGLKDSVGDRKSHV